MKKFVYLVLFVAILFTGCNQEDPNPIDLKVPNEFHGVWESVEIIPELGTKGVLEINSEDIVENGISMEKTISTVADTLKKTADQLGVDFDITVFQSNPFEGRYTVSYTATSVYTTAFYCTLQIADGQLKVTTAIAPSNTGEITEQSYEVIYKPIR